MKIVIIQHENDFEAESGVYFIEMIAKCWRDSGHEVVFVNGIQNSIQADLALLHVNLSVVPDEYVEYAKQFPIVLNSGITDIRKRSISLNLLDKNDSYDGPVIVKTDLNSGGIPEANIYNQPEPKLYSLMTLWRSLIRRARNLVIKLKLVNSDVSRMVQTEYRESFRIFKNKERVPNYIWPHEDWVVEKFIPEVENSGYVTRNAYFLGETAIGFKNVGSDPVVKDEGKGTVIDVPPSIKEYRRQVGLDYGKIDYVVKDRIPVVLDITKTIGGAYDQEFAKMLAVGIEDFLVRKTT